ncbi:MAG: dynamin family protein [Verrucomicrobiota bacterium]
MPTPPDLAELLKDLAFLIQESFLGKAKTTRNIPDAVSHAMETDVLPQLRKLLVRAERCIGKRYAVAVVGLSNAGKSTLLNALLNQQLAPASNGPCTAAVIEFEYANEVGLRLRWKDHLRKIEHGLTPEEILRRLEEMATGEPTKGHSIPDRITILTPSEFLRDGLILVDTPGFGAALSAAAKDAHDAVLKSYLETEAAQVFLVVNAKRGLTHVEKQFWQEHLVDRCDDIVVTRSDYFHKPESKQEFKQLYKHIFGTSGSFFHFVSGRDAIEVRCESGLSDEEMERRLEAAGISALKQRIGDLRNEAGQRQVLEERLRELASEIGTFLFEFRDAHGQRLKNTWKPSIWENAWRAAADPLRREIAAAMGIPDLQESPVHHP